MDTQGIDARNHTPASAAASKGKVAAAAEGFGDVLTKLFDRLAASSQRPQAGESGLEDTLAQAQARGRDARPDRPERIDDRDDRARRKDEDADEDDHDVIVAAVIEPPPHDAAKPLKTAEDETPAPDAAKSLPPTAKPAHRSTEPQAELASGKGLPATAKPAAPSQNAPQAAETAAASQTQNPIKITVQEAAVRGSTDQPLTPGAALAAEADAQADAAVDVRTPTATGNAAAGNGQSAATQQSSMSGFGNQANQGQAGTSQPAAAAQQTAPANPTTPMPASFAAQLEASQGDLSAEPGAHQIAGVAPGTTPGTANALRNTADTPAVPQLPRLSALDQIAVNIKKAIAAGKDQITINLKPAELGRIEVKLEVGADGQVSAQVRAERPETLELLQRDARGLERALQDAGLSTGSGSLSFGLRGENRPDGQAAQGRANGPSGTPDHTAEQTAPASLAPAKARASDGRIDLHV